MPSKRDLASAFAALVEDQAGPDADVVVIGHDLGAMVAYAYAAEHTPKAAAILEATPPGTGIWQQLLADPRTWHFGFHGRFAEALIEGREEIFLNRFWTEFSATGTSPMSDAQVSDTVTSLRRDAGLKASLNHFAAFRKDAEDNALASTTPLSMPVLAIGGDASLGGVIGQEMAALASTVDAQVIANAGHWLLDEAPDATAKSLLSFLAAHTTP